MIKPTVGRIVWFFTREEGHGFNEGPKIPCAAIICFVHPEKSLSDIINVCVFNPLGIPFAYQAVKLEPSELEKKVLEYWCEWMPYQKGEQSE